MKKKKALVFDDNEISREVLAEILAEADFQVVSFSDPISFLSQKEKACCSMSSEPCFDVLLTDNHMPGMSGLEFLERLEGFGCKLPAQRKAVISGAWSEADLLRAKQIGCQVFCKPTPLHEIFHWLGSA